MHHSRSHRNRKTLFATINIQHTTTRINDSNFTQSKEISTTSDYNVPQPRTTKTQHC